ncbi:WG repeat-containing protein [Flavobacterium gelidilacus]|jgi:hypothetical protein|uniref:WG repeat-containing protein n=1 Tax=Flavobacterium gelidilacus TaxID=206041 RepID=UPI0004197C04|nr:WG repeat-containing protein [Flavobacterium gelidilacus]
MKTLIIILSAIGLFSLNSCNQKKDVKTKLKNAEIKNEIIKNIAENIDYISPYHNSVAAVKKGSNWGFMDKKGAIVINFREDLVSTEINNDNYPIFSNERCLISKEKDGIPYFGYIDKSGKTVIEPQFLNATNFNKNAAIVLKLVKEKLGTNELMKNVVSYEYFEVVIDKDGKTGQYLSEEPIHITLANQNMKDKPVITSKFIADNLIAIRNKSNNWTIKKINEK